MKQEIEEAYQEMIKAQQSVIESLQGIIKAQSDTIARFMGKDGGDDN